MEDIHWEAIAEVTGQGQAEMLKGLLEAQGIPVWLSSEGAGKAYGITIGEMGTVQILVPSDKVEYAEAILGDYETGKFEQTELKGIENYPLDDEEENGE